jgi:hypothetical protein
MRKDFWRNPLQTKDLNTGVKKMSSTIDSKPELNPSDNGHTKPRFTFSQLFPAGVRQTFVGPNRAGWTTTSLYIAGAVLCLGVTSGFAWLNRPAEIAEFGKVGQQFFAEFVDPTLATSLELSTFDAKAVEPRDFKVAKSDNGQWVIPSHHDYPADAESQLADTASSVIGVERGAMVTRWSADHAKYGVVDPKQDTLGVDEVEGVGQRLTLRGDNDAALADFIVGKQVEGEFDQYYVRHPEEDEVYITTLNVDLSTKFTDWIDTDLFDVNSSDVRRVTINDYSFDELSGKLTNSQITALTREDSGNDWQLDSLDAEKEEIETDAVRDTLSAIASLKIAGVRPKQVGLTPDLQLDRDALKSQSGVERLQADLLSSGFILQPSEDGDKDQLKLIAREGELMAGTNEGLVYKLHFGRVFTGSQEELEVGFVSTSAPREDSADSDVAITDDEEAEGVNEEEAASSDADTNPGRYVFVRVDFDQTLLGEEPAKPVEPTKPQRLTELEEAEEAEESEEAKPDETASNDEEADDAKESVPAPPEKSELERLRREFTAAKSKYDTDLQAYESFQSKVESGSEKADELNQRFAKWYYVISGESYDKLALDRSSFVSTKAVEDVAPAIEETDDQKTEDAEKDD